MKQITLLIIPYFFSLSCQNQNANQVKKVSAQAIVSTPCSENYDSVLTKYAIEFNPSQIGLDKTISKELDTFISRIDTNCLRSQKNYKPFIAIILSKLYYHHLTCCNQGYDLLGMKRGSAGIIINEFQRMIGYQDSGLEMLNSGTVVEYVEHDTSLKDDASLKVLMEKIKVASERINKGG